MKTFVKSIAVHGRDGNSALWGSTRHPGGLLVWMAAGAVTAMWLAGWHLPVAMAASGGAAAFVLAQVALLPFIGGEKKPGPGLESMKANFAAALDAETRDSSLENAFNGDATGYRSLYAASRSLAEFPTLDSLPQTIVESCVKHFGADGAWLFLSDKLWEVRSLARFPVGNPLGAGADLQTVIQLTDQSFIGRSIRHSFPVVTREPLKDQIIQQWQDFSAVGDVASAASLPLVFGGRTIGALAMFSKQPLHFLPQRLEVLQVFADLASAALNSHAAVMKPAAQTGDPERTHEPAQPVRTTAQYKSAEQDREILSYSISHDLRTPLRVIKAFSHKLIGRHVASMDEEGQRMIQQIHASAIQMEDLMESLLRLSMVTNRDLQRRPLDMNGIVRSVIDELMVLEQGASVTIAVDPLHPVEADETMMRHVWQNFISNALKYTRKKKDRDIRVQSVVEGRSVVFSISDNGVGFDMEYADRLFGVFHRLHGSDEFEGTGIGLAIVQRAVQRHGGSVWAKAEVNVGAQFFFSIPMSQQE